MKRLFLLRHAEAGPSSDGSDRERALSDTGKADARALGLEMKRRSYNPDFTFCSPALRTKQTLEGLERALPDLSVEYPDKLYNGACGDLLRFIQNANDEIENLMLIAHNPGIHELTAMLAGEGAPALVSRLAAGYKPGTLSVLDCPGQNWADIQPGENPLTDLLEPLDYNAPATPARWT